MCCFGSRKKGPPLILIFVTSKSRVARKLVRPFCKTGDNCFLISRPFLFFHVTNHKTPKRSRIPASGIPLLNQCFPLIHVVDLTWLDHASTPTDSPIPIQEWNRKFGEKHLHLLSWRFPYFAPAISIRQVWTVRTLSERILQNNKTFPSRFL